MSAPPLPPPMAPPMVPPPLLQAPPPHGAPPPLPHHPMHQQPGAPPLYPPPNMGLPPPGLPPPGLLPPNMPLGAAPLPPAVIVPPYYNPIKSHHHNPTTVFLTHIPPFLRHPRNLRDWIYTTCGSVKHVFYSCPIKRKPGDVEQDDNVYVVAVIKMAHSMAAFHLVRNWTVAMDTKEELKREEGLQMKAFLMYNAHENQPLLRPEEQIGDAKIVNDIWEGLFGDRTEMEMERESIEQTMAADLEMVNQLTQGYFSIQDRQTRLDNGETVEGIMSSSNNNPLNANGDEKEEYKLDTAKVAAAAGGGAYDEEADPLNAPAVLEAVAVFKKKLEELQSSNKTKRAEFVTRRLKEEIAKAKKRLLEKKRLEEEQKRREEFPPPPPPPLPMGLPPPGMQDSGQRGVSNLPSWMTAAAGATGSTDETATTTSQDKKRSAEDMDNDSRKKKFMPSEANRDINARKQPRLDVDGESLADIRKANEEADAKAKIKALYDEAKGWDKAKILSTEARFPSVSATSIPEIRKFVKDQLVEYLGEEEATLIDYVMNHLGKKEDKERTTKVLLEEMEVVLEEDAETFVYDVFQKVLQIGNS